MTRHFLSGRKITYAWSLLLVVSAFLSLNLCAQVPAIGTQAPDFALSTPAGKRVQLSNEAKQNGVVLVVLRGYPGYQCPFCVKQVHDFVEHATDFAAKGKRVLLVYPGPPADLDQHAREFLEKQADLPANIVLVTDPDYAMTDRYGLRWDAPHETAYPSIFILDKHRIILFEKISKSHGDRLSAEEALSNLR